MNSPAETDAEFRLRFRRWLGEHAPARLRRPVERMRGREQRDWTRLLFEHGWRAPSWPVESGGLGLPIDRVIVMEEELERADMARVLDIGEGMVGPTLMKFGTQEQKARYLPRILRLDDIWCQGYSEPGAGSDLASLRTRAVREGDHYVVNGQKIWTTHAGDADMMFALVRTDPSAVPQAGISCLLIDMRSPGITVRPIRNIAGEEEFCEVFLDGVRVPVANRVGEENAGWTVAKSLLGSERLAIGSPLLARRAMDALMRLWADAGEERRAPFAARCAQLSVELHGLTCLYKATVNEMRAGRTPNDHFSMLKLVSSELFQRISETALEFAGAGGALGSAPAGGGEVDVAMLYFIARPASIYGGSNDVQRNILARSMLDLPKP